MLATASPQNASDPGSYSALPNVMYKREHIMGADRIEDIIGEDSIYFWLKWCTRIFVHHNNSSKKIFITK